MELKHALFTINGLQRHYDAITNILGDLGFSIQELFIEATIRGLPERVFRESISLDFMVTHKDFSLIPKENFIKAIPKVKKYPLYSNALFKILNQYGNDPDIIQALSIFKWEYYALALITFPVNCEIYIEHQLNLSINDIYNLPEHAIHAIRSCLLEILKYCKFTPIDKSQELIKKYFPEIYHEKIFSAYSEIDNFDIIKLINCNAPANILVRFIMLSNLNIYVYLDKIAKNDELLAEFMKVESFRKSVKNYCGGCLILSKDTLKSFLPFAKELNFQEINKKYFATDSVLAYINLLQCDPRKIMELVNPEGNVTFEQYKKILAKLPFNVEYFNHTPFFAVEACIDIYSQENALNAIGYIIKNSSSRSRNESWNSVIRVFRERNKIKNINSFITKIYELDPRITIKSYKEIIKTYNIRKDSPMLDHPKARNFHRRVMLKRTYAFTCHLPKCVRLEFMDAFVFLKLKYYHTKKQCPA
jgi:hypothetical protein